MRPFGIDQKFGCRRHAKQMSFSPQAACEYARSKDRVNRRVRTFLDHSKILLHQVLGGIYLMPFRNKIFGAGFWVAQSRGPDRKL